MSRCQAINRRRHNPDKRGHDISMMEINEDRTLPRLDSLAPENLNGGDGRRLFVLFGRRLGRTIPFFNFFLPLG